MKSFTVEEIRNYLKQQDSFGDAMYNLNEENIANANISREIEPVTKEELYELYINGDIEEDLLVEHEGVIYNLDAKQLEYLQIEYRRADVAEIIQNVNSMLERGVLQVSNQKN